MGVSYLTNLKVMQSVSATGKWLLYVDFSWKPNRFVGFTNIPMLSFLDGRTTHEIRASKDELS